MVIDDNELGGFGQQTNRARPPKLKSNLAKAKEPSTIDAVDQSARAFRQSKAVWTRRLAQVAQYLHVSYLKAIVEYVSG